MAKEAKIVTTLIPKETLEKINFESVYEADKFALESIDPSRLHQVVKRWHAETLRFNLKKFPTFKNSDWLCLRSLIRDDYKEFFHLVTAQIPGNLSLYEDYKSVSSLINPNILNLIVNYRWILKFIKAEKTEIKVGCYFRIIQYLYILSKYDALSCKNLLVFADMQPVENLAVQLYQAQGKNTVTLQHGLYVDYEDMKTVNVINYRNHCSDYFLAWGENTKRLIEKYHRSKVIICGKPKVYGLPDIKKPNKSKEELDFLVVTDQRIFDEQNKILLKIVTDLAKKLSKNVYVRFHPSNNKSLYKKTFPNIKELVEIKQEFIVVGHTTSMIYEALELGYEAFKLRSEVPALEYPSGRQFSDKDELHSAIFQRKTSEEGLRNYIACMGERSLAKYHQFFSSL